jgi:hypothetical protein
MRQSEPLLLDLSHGGFLFASDPKRSEEDARRAQIADESESELPSSAREGIGYVRMDRAETERRQTRNRNLNQ